MAYNFGDGFDLYAASADAINGYWDSGSTGSFSLSSPGRFAGSQYLAQSSGAAYLVKSSSVNDAVHHLVVAFRQTTAITGSTVWFYLLLGDGATGQCAVAFRSDGAILLASGSALGTVLDTYTGAFPATNTWYAFEFEIVINNTTGSWAVRKNGNTSNDHALGSLNTRGGTTNNYANRLTVGSASGGSGGQGFDDLFWQSGASTGTWLGDIRCYTRMPASDVSVHFTPLATNVPFFPIAFSSNANVTANQVRHTPFTAPTSGTIGSVTVAFSTASTGNFKCAIYASAGGVPTTVLGTATAISAPGVGAATFTFGTPVSVTAGTAYFVSFIGDTTSGQWANALSASSGLYLNGGVYSTFPLANPTITGSNAAVTPTIYITPATTANFWWVSEAQEDGTTSYVYDSNPGDADFYGIGTIASTPLSTIAVTTRGYMQKSDAGSRTAAVQLKSGTTTVATPTLTLTTSGWQWAWRTDLVDPNTSAAWTNAAVNSAQIGPTVIA